ncbi:leucine-rich repeat domain-containing protein [Fulvivirga maritima]|uniref:leucine-rich repeat domain-containing protein n=1 Tax=Fulvivirga maritima TaxID=2904247 RepID=UPI001F418F5D|nr:leucine-rich repeat domain-containing protein [Fulvivirga maritima]UII27512.1 leucine-rich repeat domain-containing protein [Fulvivirga maritima]
MEELIISLTDKDSHAIKREAGQGSLSLGPEHLKDKLDFDVIVGEHQNINWDCFNNLYTPHGQQNAHLYPNGDWPRWFYYYGNDSGFSFWSEKRKIEYFTWKPFKQVSVDFENSNINQLTIIAEEHPIKLKIGSGITTLVLDGNLKNLDIEKAGSLENIHFNPAIEESDASYRLPEFPAFKKSSSIHVTVKPVGQSFDCEQLLQFEYLKSLSLSGNMTNLHVLSKLPNLESLSLRYVPDLSDLPELNTWKFLKSFIGWNIEEGRGKVLRKELNKLSKEREMQYSSVSQLRKQIWFTTEYGIPFTAWEGKNAKLAVKVYKSTVKKLGKAKVVEEVKTLLIEFAKTFNELPQIETSEREDIAEAINQLRQVPSLEIDAKKAMGWFDEVRDY